MSNGKQAAGLLGIPLLVIVLMIYIVLHEPPQPGISRAVAARSVTLAMIDSAEFAEWEEEGWASHFSVDMEREWYVPYMDYLYAKGYLSTERLSADRQTAEGILTYGDAEAIAAAIDESLVRKVHVTDANRTEVMPEDVWWKFYDALLKVTDPDGKVGEVTFALYGTVDNLAWMDPWRACTDAGTYIFTGLSLDAYIDRELTVLARDSELIRVISAEDEVVYHNVWLVDGDDEAMQIYLDGVLRKISFGKKIRNLDEVIQNLADLRLEDGKIIKISLKKDRIKGKLLSVQEDSLEIEGYGIVQTEDDCPVLKIDGTPETLSRTDLLVGSENLEFVTADGKICAVLSKQSISDTQIRVLLMSEGFQSIYHQRISLVCDAPVMMTQNDEESEIDAGEILEFLPGDEKLRDGRIILTPRSGSEIRVTSMERTDGQPSYAGRLEVLDTENGLVLINELDMESYLERVVPSEMSASFHAEALKAQAVCARTYAYTQLQGNKYSQYGAQLDDSTNFQVYNNVEPEASAAAAVQATAGKMLFYDGEPISAYYFSTSCGNTTDGSVWGMDPEEAPYLKSVALQPSRKTFDWSNEDEFRVFIKRTNVNAYDSDSMYFRWSMTTTAEILEETFDGIGTIQNVYVSKRGAGGVALEMVIKGTDGEMTVSGQSSIRAALCDPSLSLKRNDGKTVQGWSSLPSAFLIVEPDGKNEEGVQKFTIYGGGYGHGAGMSQNGAQGMAEDGMDYEEILKFFYEGVTIGQAE
ncbi:MAG: SpoIID/LytB domain-containing protein [Clostridiales bacterium]|nr:SpoIID/LytB domain-containing protein [Clostridiales bacterium]